MSHLALPIGVFGVGVALGAAGASAIQRNETQRKEKAMVSAIAASEAASKSPDTALQLARRSWWGASAPTSDLLVHAAYVSAYDRRLRHPSWTAEHLTATSIQRPPVVPGTPPAGSPDRSRSVFKEDPRIPLPFRARMADYFRSGYDRGHMVPAADAKSSQTALDETFYLTNIAPQVGEGFNRDYWAHFEDFTRRLTGRFADVYVFTVPLYLPRRDIDGKYRVTYEVIGEPSNVAVPTHFAKVILASGLPVPTRTQSAPAALPAPSNPSPSVPSPTNLTASIVSGRGPTLLGAFVLPNAIIPNEVPLRNFIVPVESVEKASGVNFFPDHIKQVSKALCDGTDCSIIVREFKDRSSSRPSTPSPLPAGRQR
ncbi:hypothetical protein IE81DRAFT_311123 [Ceraceosorus guamensis]|uniref:Endonuclease n=1 Tax=Ceraceosorus guamensis TaxID=1522189 RepID=A0A316W860_9BASI|nr:hypothetical protein IE81DRAFT_311123 [Ceraceosorus guamensis]PWN44233.1 hypothetical protein IE81DRAFT_311123 [Ceraceosorus guamensis]